MPAMRTAPLSGSVESAERPLLPWPCPPSPPDLMPNGEGPRSGVARPAPVDGLGDVCTGVVAPSTGLRIRIFDIKRLMLPLLLDAGIVPPKLAVLLVEAGVPGAARLGAAGALAGGLR